ncbi:hypothetical protein J7T55_001371 [Diaporthe amygdali]|uniref:uncharacterized protein n=1 Tax=Phomopsis amygdali TaxID=1214568 RepID=UPI0022FE5A2C|nr:uncharacterized protein J7T55_001371 [Diaporthe amygdali]KAJ0103752.1 hypothetical protein J7T55_001371 [Diaporthe amygdali]
MSHLSSSTTESGSGSGSGSTDAANTANTADTSAIFQPRSKYRIIKDGWGSRTNFQGSHGLKMDPDGLEEGNLILEGYQQCERDTWYLSQQEKQASQETKVYNSRKFPTRFL